MSLFNKRINELTFQYYYFRISFLIVDIIINSFYSILIFKTFNSPTNIFIDALILLISMWVGVIIGSFLIGYFGYITLFKISFFFLFLSSLFIALFINQFELLFIPFAVSRGFARGLFWSNHNIFILKELNLSKRNRALSNIFSLNSVFSIVFPVLLGATISFQGNYQLVFILGAIISLMIIIPRFKYNKIIRNEIKLSEFKKVIKHKWFFKYAVLVGMYQGIDAAMISSFLFIPYIFINQEFGFGIFIAVFNLVGAFLAFFFRNIKIEKSKRIGFLGLLFNLTGNILLSFNWSLTGLIVRNILVTLGNSTSKPLDAKLDLGIRYKLIGNEVNNIGIETNLILENIFTVGRIISLTLILIGISLTQNIFLIFSILILSSSIFNIFYQFLFSKIYTNKELNEIDNSEIMSVDTIKSNLIHT